MRISRIYTDQALEEGACVELDSRSSHYLRNVLRVKAGQALVLFNGNGCNYAAAISTKSSNKKIFADITGKETVNNESPLTTVLGIALSKGDRFDWVIQKATELGVSDIQPLYTERVEVKLKGDRQAKKMQHWQNIVIAACEQSGRAVLPTLHEPISYAQWLAQATTELKCIFSASTQSLNSLPDQANSISLTIGPEGGFSEDELQQANESGFSLISFGQRILRTETAPIVALSLVQAKWGDFS